MREKKRYYLYIMASRALTFYTGVTGDLYNRALQHEAGEIEGFTRKYNVNRLVYSETFKHMNNALAREKKRKSLDEARGAAEAASLQNKILNGTAVTVPFESRAKTA
jgi:putative endonuclease